ncbi:MAG: hypothetical protein CSA81_11275 [Acidobacteria bacterium]|nr:MAG: hypothetical protein CSA81_11275 [Acidobacteriota bacterium]PIE89956.1 MAG: hypothetical protein CR997_08235 [Acidobacteriota bacterium]
MWILFLILFTFGGLSTIVKSSLLDDFKTRSAYWAVISLIGFLSYPFMKQVSFVQIETLLTQKEWLERMAVWLVFESLVTTLLSFKIIRSHFGLKIKKWQNLLFFMPSLVVVAGFILGNASMFYLMDGLSFLKVATFTSLGCFVIALFLTAVFRWLFFNWNLQFNILIFMAFFQLLVAMFLPLLLRESYEKTPFFIVELQPTLFFLAGSLFFGVTGYLLFNTIRRLRHAKS